MLAGEAVRPLTARRDADEVHFIRYVILSTAMLQTLVMNDIRGSQTHGTICSGDWGVIIFISSSEVYSQQLCHFWVPCKHPFHQPSVVSSKLAVLSSIKIIKIVKHSKMWLEQIQILSLGLWIILWIKFENFDLWPWAESVMFTNLN